MKQEVWMGAGQSSKQGQRQVHVQLKAKIPSPQL